MSGLGKVCIKYCHTDIYTFVLHGLTSPWQLCSTLWCRQQWMWISVNSISCILQYGVYARVNTIFMPKLAFSAHTSMLNCITVQWYWIRIFRNRIPVMKLHNATTQTKSHSVYNSINWNIWETDREGVTHSSSPN